MKPSKYNNKKTIIDGITFASKAEGIRYSQLKMLKKAGEIQNIDRQPRFKYLDRTGKKTLFTYVADFAYERDGKLVIEDVKGFRTKEYILKKKLIEDRFGIEIIEIK